MNSNPFIHFQRSDLFFVNNAAKMESLKTHSRKIDLTSDQILHPDTPQHYIVRKGKIRISQFLDDDREITRTILQAGSVFSTFNKEDIGDKPAADIYSLPGIVVMSLTETELWAFSENALDDCKL